MKCQFPGRAVVATARPLRARRSLAQDPRRRRRPRRPKTSTEGDPQGREACAGRLPGGTHPARIRPGNPDCHHRWNTTWDEDDRGAGVREPRQFLIHRPARSPSTRRLAVPRSRALAVRGADHDRGGVPVDQHLIHAVDGQARWSAPRSAHLACRRAITRRICDAKDRDKVAVIPSRKCRYEVAAMASNSAHGGSVTMTSIERSGTDVSPRRLVETVTPRRANDMVASLNSAAPLSPKVS